MKFVLTKPFQDFVLQSGWASHLGRRLPDRGVMGRKCKKGPQSVHAAGCMTLIQVARTCATNEQVLHAPSECTGKLCAQAIGRKGDTRAHTHTHAHPRAHAHTRTHARHGHQTMSRLGPHKTTPTTTLRHSSDLDCLNT